MELKKDSSLKAMIEASVYGVPGMMFGCAFLLPALFLADILEYRNLLMSHWFWLWAGSAGGFMFGKFVGVSSERKVKSAAGG